MRPLVLKLKNIGPFLDETVNFENLDNMFIITGKTGAGKTFIFDAMTYALYGVLSGNRAGYEKDLRSRYAPEDEECYVEFTFAISDDVFRVKRTVNPHSVFIEQKKENSFESLYDKKDKKIKEKNDFLQSLIGLTAQEFSKVILLPQGAFSDFLKQNSSERKETLKKLFPVQDYTKLIDKAQEKVKKYEEEIRSIDAVINGEYKSFSDPSLSFDGAEEKIAAMEKEIKTLQKNEDNYSRLLNEISVHETNLKHDLNDAVINENNRKKLEVLNKQGPEMEVLETELVLAEKANALREFINAKKTASENYEKNLLNKKAKEEVFSSSKSNLEKLEASENDMKSLKDEIAGLKTDLDSLSEKLKKVTEYMELKNDVSSALEKKTDAFNMKDQLEKKLAELSETLEGRKIEDLINEAKDHLMQLNEKKNNLLVSKEKGDERDSLCLEISKIEKEIESHKIKISDAENLVSRTSNTLEAKKQEAEIFRVRNTAFSLVSALKAGSPCPVCGSLEHPAPCAAPEGLLNPLEEVPVFEKAFEEAKEKLSVLQSEMSSFEAKLTSGKESFSKYNELDKTEEIKLALSKVTDDFNYCENECGKYQALQSELSELNIKITEKTKEYADAEKEYAAVYASFESLGKTLGDNPENLQEKYESLKETYLSKESAYSEWSKKVEQAKLDFSSAESALEEAGNALENVERQKISSEKILTEKIEASDFSDEKEVEENLEDLSEISEKRKVLNSYKEELRSLKDAVKNARQVDSIEKLEDALKADSEKTDLINHEFKQNHASVEALKTTKITFENSYNKVKESKEKKAVLEEEALPYRKIARALNGSNPANVPFDVWALGMYFEQVVEFASRRFFEISDHRFEFVLRDLADKEGNGKKGLELQILDHNTPNAKVSDPSDLSGGETFEASLSLALALTDVVQNNSGGIVLDSLFIDEGFGTLDDELLDKTMEILTDLSESKMIGFISHVESLQNSESGINSRIDVIKTDNGSHIEIE